MVRVKKIIDKTETMSVHVASPQKNDVVEWGGRIGNLGIEDTVDNTNCQKDDIVDES